MLEQPNRKSFGKAERDLVALGIAIAAIILFVATGGTVLPQVVRSMIGTGDAPDHLLVNALLLNIALIIFGWRRYRELTREIDERRKAEAIARRLAEQDPLTECLNRRSMEKVTENLIRQSTAHGRAVAFVMIDLDNFKQINDMNGHGIGDRVLTTIATRLRHCLPKDAPLARLGGDEFSFAIAYDPKQSELVDDIISRIFETVALRIEIDGLVIDSTMSIGVASDHDQSGIYGADCDSEKLIHHADIAMYQAKKSGKNRYFWFEPSMENELRFRNELEAGIRRGVVQDEFVPYYEQQIDLDTGELVGFEMLARWQSPELGVVSPEVFIPIAEEIGVISQLSEQLMVRAFADALKWDPALTLSVNISAIQMRDPWFAQRLLKLLVNSDFPPQRLEIEITESCFHEDIALVRSTIESLRNQGVRVCLDDFGTGYSSLTQLRTLPFDRIKIDRSFVREMHNNGATKIVDAIISLGNGLEMPMTAEGIESETILATLREMGPLKGQGYLYGRPETAEMVIERLKNASQLAAGAEPDQAEIAANPPLQKRQQLKH